MTGGSLAIRARWREVLLDTGRVSSPTEGQPIEIRLMNEYGGGMPLWDVADLDDEWWSELLTGELESDLEKFADRWSATVPDEIFDDRFDHLPVVPRVIDAARAVRRLLRPAERRALAVEMTALRAQGEELRNRLQAELGDGYRVTYVHWHPAERRGS